MLNAFFNMRLICAGFGLLARSNDIFSFGRLPIRPASCIRRCTLLYIESFALFLPDKLVSTRRPEASYSWNKNSETAPFRIPSNVLSHLRMPLSTATSEKARIGCIYDCLHAMVLCNISAYCFKLCLSLQDQVFHPSTAYRCIFLSSPGPHNDRIHSSDIHGKDRLPSQ